MTSPTDNHGMPPFRSIRCLDCGHLAAAEDVSARMQRWIDSENDRTLLAEKLTRIVEQLQELHAANARMEQALSALAEQIAALAAKMNWPGGAA